jgi:hypothetical protein
MCILRTTQRFPGARKPRTTLAAVASTHLSIHPCTGVLIAPFLPQISEGAAESSGSESSGSESSSSESSSSESSGSDCSGSDDTQDGAAICKNDVLFKVEDEDVRLTAHLATLISERHQDALNQVCVTRNPTPNVTISPHAPGRH